MTNQAPDVLTFGCRLNIAESEVMQRHASSVGLREAVIINSCAVTAEAERQAGQAIRRVKKERPTALVIVTGCASHINPQKYADMPEVDHVVGNDVKLKIESFRALVPQDEVRSVPMEDQPLQAAPLQRAFVQIQNGCDHLCTFCIIPYGRGKSRSLSLDEIVAQLRAHTEQGFQEIVLTGVDITSYGQDLAHKPTLGAIIQKALAAVPELKRLRLSSLDPAAIDEDLWDLLSSEPRLMPHLHLSLQAGDDMVLKRMKRRHRRDDVIRLCQRARQARPDIVLGADLIAGFPTETEAMFENTAQLVTECGLTWLHVFPYSARTGTPAAKMPQVHGSLRKERAEKLRLLGDKAATAYYRSLIGKRVTVLVEKNGMGCTPHFAKLKLLGTAPIGQIVNARCVEMKDGTLAAEIVV